MHMVCAGCASKSLARSARCPSCRTEVDGTAKSVQMNGVVDCYFAARPGRKRAAEELSRLDDEERLLAERVDRMVRQRHAVSILQAVREGDAETVLELADGADVSERDEDGNPLLHIAVALEDLNMVRALLAGGADLALETEYGTALNVAARICNHAIILAFLQAGADASEIDDLGERLLEYLLMQATRKGLARAVGALVQAGVDSSWTEPGSAADGRETGDPKP